MKLSLNWIREYVDVPADLKRFADDLTMAGLEIEEMHDISASQLVEAGGSGSLGDTVLDVKITPNRGDWLSTLGIAREVAALSRQLVRMPNLIPLPSEAQDTVKISIAAPDLCKRYVGIVLRGAEIRESPNWMKDRLIAAGMRPINNIVDITNYVMLELGQPLHAFDIRLLHGSEVIVRRAVAGEVIVSIDNVERKLDSDMLVIADHDRPVAIAGIMGGLESEIADDTSDILLESANFESVSTRRTSKRLGMVTESSYRFERGVDPSITAFAGIRAAQLMVELAGAEIVGGELDVYPSPVRACEVKLRPAKANALLGTSIDSREMVSILNAYGILTSECEDVLISRVPTFRPDITLDVDLIEEIGRGFGYDNLATTLPETPLRGRDSRDGEFSVCVRQLLLRCGMQEVHTHSVVSEKLVRLCGREGERIAIRNPLNEELNSMRAMLVPNLLDVVGHNQSHGTMDVSAFEIGNIYFLGDDGEIVERSTAAGAMTGSMWNSVWSFPREALVCDFFTCKGVIESVLGGLGLSNIEWLPVVRPLFHPTRCASILIAGSAIGVIGEVTEAACEVLDVRGKTYAFELDMERLMRLSTTAIRYEELPKFPAVNRHLTADVAQRVIYADIESAARAAAGSLCEEVRLVDIYTGERVSEGRKSVTISIILRASDRTLTEDTVNSVMDAVRSELSSKAGAAFQ